MLTLNRLYKLNRGNQNQTVGIIVKGGTGTTLYGSTSIPTEFADMVDCNSEALVEGLHTFAILPEYIVLDGDADGVEIIGMSAKDTGTDIES